MSNLEPVHRLTPSEFRAEYERRGWIGLTLAEHWGKHPVSLSKIVNNQERSPYWDDAIKGLPKTSEPVRRLTPSEFRVEYERRGWKGLTLAERWDRHPVSLSKIVNDLERACHWDDAVKGLPMVTPFRFEASTFVNNKRIETEDGDYDPETRIELKRLRSLYPEISHWGDIALAFAWGDYSEDCWMLSWESVTDRNENFLNYLCWRQTRGAYPRGAGDEVADEAREWNENK